MLYGGTTTGDRERQTVTTFTYEHKVHKALAAGRLLRGWTQAQMAELMADATGDDQWNTDRITATENGRRKVGPDELRTFAEVQGFDVEFYWYGPPANRRSVDLRDLNRANPGYVNSDADGDRLSRRILKTDHSERVDHELGGCVDCRMNPDFHVQSEWLMPGGQIPGQMVIDLRDEALEKWLQGAA